LTRARGLGLAALAAGLLLAASASPAGAARGLQLGLTDPLYQDANAGTRDLWLDRSAAAGANTVILGGIWGSIASGGRPADPRNPGDPAYDWGQLDNSVRAATARGLQVVILVNTAPSWAEGPGRPANARGGSWKPDPDALGDFGHAIATRYSGGFSDPQGGPLPRVRFWQLWAEPNQSAFLTPQWAGKTPFAPLHYRLMLNAFYAQVHAVHPDNVVATGGTAPYGDAPGGERMRPLVFWRSVFCLKKGKKKGRRGSGRLRSTKCPVVPKLDVLAHNPINTSGGPRRSAINPDDASTPDLGELRRLLRAAEARGHVAPGGHRPLWATELWWESNPPDTAIGVPAQTQGRWLELAIYLLWKAGANLVVNFHVVDEPYNPADPFSTFQTGIFFGDGSPKPSYTAFHFPFVTERRSKRAVTAWGRAPAGGTVAIQVLRGGSWRTLKTLGASRGGVFLTTLKLRGKHQLRASVGGDSSLTWFQG
jgi:hypothetical protein